MSTITPNMSLKRPVVSVDPGPTYAIDIDTTIDLVDAHDHSSGKGVKITPAGLNISADLPFGSNKATGLKEVQLIDNGAAPADLGGLGRNGAELYYKDGNGNVVQLTSGGGVSAGISAGQVVNVSATYNAAAGTADLYLLVDTSAIRTINLHAATTVRRIFIKDLTGSAGTNNITVNRAGADTIDGATSLVINVNRAAVMLLSNGATAWSVF